MTSPGASGSRPPGSSGDAGRQQAIGALIIVVAVVLGAILLFRGLSSTDEVATERPADDASVTTVDRDAPPPTDELVTTIAPAAPTEEITVLVANGSGVAGLAGQTTEQLASEGFDTIAATDATPPSVAKTAVYAVSDNEADAAEVAKALGLPASVVGPLPRPLPVGSVATATVVVVLGADFPDFAAGGE